jgi:SAM-dependent methyltransferase
MSVDTNSRAGRATRHAWEHFAEVDPYLYILTEMKRSDPGLFWLSGRQVVERELLPLLHRHGLQNHLALELGCGLGRLVLPLSHYFDNVVGVDISTGMIERATTLARDNGISNVAFLPVSGPENLFRQASRYSGGCDLIYSLLVFQHIPDFAEIEGYLHVIGALLYQHGLAYLQFDTRPQTLLYHLKSNLPDFLLPRFSRRGIRRIRRSAQDLESCFCRAGLEIVGEASPHTALHRYTLRVRPRARNGTK